MTNPDPGWYRGHDGSRYRIPHTMTAQAEQLANLPTTEPAPGSTCQRRHQRLGEPLERCTLPEGHGGDHDFQPIDPEPTPPGRHFGDKGVHGGAA